MTPEIMNKRKKDLFQQIDLFCEDILSSENNKPECEKKIELLCHILSCLHVKILPEFTESLTKSKVIKWLKTLKPLLGFRFYLSHDDSELVIVKKEKRELNIYISEGESIIITNYDHGCSDEYIYGYQQFIYSLEDWCGVDIIINDLDFV